MLDKLVEVEVVVFSEGRTLGDNVLLGTSGDLLEKPVQAWLEWR